MTILLVDDEQMVLEVTQQMLQHLGYHVLTAHNGEQAVHKLQNQKHDIELVILDMVMPGMGGRSAFSQIKDIAPAVKVLLSTGYSFEGQAEDIMEKGCDGFIQKPFDLDDLDRKLRDILPA